MNTLVYGPRQFAGQGYKSVIVKSTERILAGLGPTVFGDGEQELDYVFVDDVIDATIRALEAAASGEIINVGSGTGTPVNRLVDTLLSVSGRALPKLVEPPDWTAGSSRVADIANGERPLTDEDGGRNILIEAFKCLAIEAPVEVHAGR